MTEAAISLSAATGPEPWKTRSPIANLALDHGRTRLGSGVLWRPGASEGRTQAER